MFNTRGGGFWQFLNFLSKFISSGLQSINETVVCETIGNKGTNYTPMNLNFEIEETVSISIQLLWPVDPLIWIIPWFSLSHVSARLRKQCAMMHSLLEVLTEETLSANPPDRVMLRRTLAFKQVWSLLLKKILLPFFNNRQWHISLNISCKRR